MDIIINLSDGQITKIITDSTYEESPDYYGINITLFSAIDIYFKYDGENNGYWRFYVYARDVELSTFLDFFYGKDFSNVKFADFCHDLVNHLGGYNDYGVQSFWFAEYDMNGNKIVDRHSQLK